MTQAVQVFQGVSRRPGVVCLLLYQHLVVVAIVFLGSSMVTGAGYLSGKGGY